MLEELGRALGLMLVFEGIIPFLSPNRWRDMAASLANVDDRAMRFVGLLSMLIGVCLLIF